MREIKFRAWDKNLETMLEPALSIIEWKYDTEYTRGYMEKYLEFLEFTGLKDKNGKYVYEGDIVKCSSGCPHKVIFKKELGGKFIGGMPTWYLDGLLEGYAWTRTEEVIGNVFETPELLQ